MMVTLTAYLSDGTTHRATFAPSDGHVTWRLPTAGGYGEAVLRLSRDSAAWATGIITAGRRLLVQVDDPAGGRWVGLSHEVSIDRGGAEVRALPLDALAGQIIVPGPHRMEGMTAGAIAHLACQLSVVGMASTVLRLGTFAEAPPIVGSYVLHRQTLASVLGDLAQQVGQEWSVDADGRLSWLVPGGRVIETHLVDGGQLVETVLSGDTNGQAPPVDLIVAIGNGGTAVSVAGPGANGALVARTLTLDEQSDSAAVLASAARGARDRLVQVAPTFTTKLDRSLAVASTVAPSTGGGWGRMRWGLDPWGGIRPRVATAGIGDVREGDYLLVHLPRQSANGLSMAARVTARTITIGSAWIDLEIQALADWTPTAVAATPVAPTRRTLGAEGGNVVERLLGLERQLSGVA
jgi:hypothetical protein